MRSSNPTLQSNAFANFGYLTDRSEMMTVQGVITKTLICLFCVLLTASYTWYQFYTTGDVNAVSGWMTVGLIGGLVLALVTIFKKEWAMYSAPAYALFEGLFLGGISAMFEMQFHGIVIQAVGLTFGTMFCMLFIYQSGLIQVTDKFRIGVFAATGAIALVYIVSLVLGFFGIQVPFIYSNGLIGIGFSLLVVGIAALNLVLDFDFIERAAAQGAPKYMEWYASFGLMVTLIWLYLEFLRLLSKIRSR